MNRETKKSGNRYRFRGRSLNIAQFYKILQIIAIVIFNKCNIFCILGYSTLLIPYAGTIAFIRHGVQLSPLFIFIILWHNDTILLSHVTGRAPYDFCNF